jgi:hypothetical protein
LLRAHIPRLALACISRRVQHLMQAILYGLNRSYSINTGIEIEARYSTLRRPYCTDFEVTIQQKFGTKFEGKYSKLNRPYCFLIVRTDVLLHRNRE